MNDTHTPGNADSEFPAPIILAEVGDEITGEVVDREPFTPDWTSLTTEDEEPEP